MPQLFGLLEDVLLPGEERPVGSPSLDALSLKALNAAVGSKVVFVTVTAPHELPTLVAGRHATEAEVLRAEGETLVVRGVGRVRIAKASRSEPPYEASCEPAEYPVPAKTVPIAQGLKALADALAAGGTPEGGPTRLNDAAAALLRAATPAGELPRLMRAPIEKALTDAAGLVRGRIPAFQAEARLEEVARALTEAPSPAQRRRLWSRVVEVQKRLDLEDPTNSADLDDLGKLEKRLRQAGMPREARDMAKREMRLLRGMDSKNSEMTTYLAHLDLMARLPWHPDELPPPDLAKVQKVLDRDHAGMEKVKRRVLEYLAVRALGGSSQSTILSLVGPPGTGKTTIARAISEALGRPFARVSLGGVHDECELRGFRPSFIAASAGRIIQAIANVGSQSALLLLDEIDKLGTDTSRSPTGALLEILDPEQHEHFSDNFLGTPYDLSNILFICTANDATRINPTLRDRLEEVELDGYSLEEKVGLVHTHLMPRILRELALGAEVDAADEVLIGIIEGHTHEAGLRQLKQRLASILRARALAKVKDGIDPSGPITPDEVTKVLGRGRAPRREREPVLPPGTAYGLSVSGEGGALLPIEVVRLPGRGKLQLTGRLGEVLKESARAVLSHLHFAREAYGIEEAAFQADLHVHLPDGATPKDGPSAGVALAVAMTSALKGQAARADVAFTGEMTLSGRVLAVGGVRAKSLAAERAGMSRIVLPAENVTDLPEALRATPVLISQLDAALAEAFRKDEETRDGSEPALAEQGAKALLGRLVGGSGSRARPALGR